MIDASLEKLKTTLKLQLEQGQPEDASGPSEKDLDDMLKNLDIFNLLEQSPPHTLNGVGTVLRLVPLGRHG